MGLLRRAEMTMIVTRRRRRVRTRRTKNVFVRLINSTRTRCYQIIKLSDSSSDTDDDTEDELERLKSAVEKREGIPREKQSFLALEKDDCKEEEEEREEEEEEESES